MNKKLMRVWMIIPILSLIALTCVIFYITGVAGSVVCFGVDSADHLYVGFGKVITVYKDEKVIKELSPKTSRAYLFTIMPDDTILLTTSSTDYTLDLDGNILTKTEDAGSQLYNDLQKGKKDFISQKGDHYKMRNVWGRTRIEKNGKVVYKEPVISVIVGYVILAVVAILLICVFSAFKLVLAQGTVLCVDM